MRLYQLSKTGGAMCCSCKGGMVRPHNPLKNKVVGGGAGLLLSSNLGAGMISRVAPIKQNEPIPNTETLQKKLANLNSIKLGGKKGKYISL